MNTPKKLTITRKTLVSAKQSAKQTKQAQAGEGPKAPSKTTSICPFICW